jgi:hypothetical protein
MATTGDNNGKEAQPTNDPANDDPPVGHQQEPDVTGKNVP